MADFGDIVLAENANRRNTANQDATNALSMKLAWEKENRERGYALDDWNRTNAYNSPEQQMNRLRQAGVNPHLAFGKGGENTAAMIRGSQSPNPNLDSPKVIAPNAGGNKILEFAQLKQMQAQTDQTQQVIQNLKVDQLLKVLETAGKSTSNQMALVDYEVKQKTANAAVKKLWADADLAGLNISHEQNQFNIKEELANQGLKSAQRGYDIQGQNLENLRMDNQIKDQILQTGDIENKTRLINQLFLQNGLDGQDTYYLKTIAKQIAYARNQSEIDSIIEQAKKSRK